MCAQIQPNALLSHNGSDESLIAVLSSQAGTIMSLLLMADENVVDMRPQTDFATQAAKNKMRACLESLGHFIDAQSFVTALVTHENSLSV